MSSCCLPFGAHGLHSRLKGGGGKRSESKGPKGRTTSDGWIAIHSQGAEHLRVVFSGDQCLIVLLHLRTFAKFHAGLGEEVGEVSLTPK